jgi:hypothetical protein
MPETRDGWPAAVFAACVVFAFVNVLLLTVKPRPGEQALWRHLHVRRARRLLTRTHRSEQRQTLAEVAASARRNILWHAGLTLLIGGVTLHPLVRSASYRGAVYAFALFGSLAYLIGSIVQRHKIAIVRLRAARHPSPPRE